MIKLMIEGHEVPTQDDMTVILDDHTMSLKFRDVNALQEYILLGAVVLHLIPSEHEVVVFDVNGTLNRIPYRENLIINAEPTNIIDDYKTEIFQS